ncbi:hypothetical protein [Bacillus sp. B15-48]|nr:hypothetical protein [Bacillus sp. B15-48]
MYEIIDETTKNIVTIYIIFLAACLVTYPLIRLIVTAAGALKWK